MSFLESPSCWVFMFSLLCFAEIVNYQQIFLDCAGLEKNFNQWDPLIDGQDDNLIPGTNVTVLQSAI